MALLSVSNAVTTASDADQTEPKMIEDSAMNRDDNRLLRSMTDVDAGSVHEERDGLLSLPEELEDLVEQHHHVREIFTEWCLEGKAPEKVAEGTEPGSEDARAAELYKKFIDYHSEKGVTGRKLTVVECKIFSSHGGSHGK